MAEQSMIERVAREIAKSYGDDFDNAFRNKRLWIECRGEGGGRFRDINEPFQTDYLDMARAAIAAMREPTPAMIDHFVSRALQVQIGGSYTWSDYARDQWQTMIDAALQERG